MPNFQVVVKQDVFGKEMINVMNWQLSLSTPAYLQSFTDSLAASYVSNVTIHLANDWSFNSVVFRQMDGGAPFTTEFIPAGGAFAGVDGAEVLPTTVCLLVSTTFVGSRPNRGRIYFAGTTEGSQSNSGYSSAIRTAFSNMVTSWGTGLAVSGGTAFLRIARTDFPLNLWPLDNPVDAAVARTNPATQRKRRLGSN